MTRRTLADIEAHLASATTTEINGQSYRGKLPRIVCGDGTTLSVQVGCGLYCAPRDNYGPWGSVEVGYPSRKLNGLMQWAENPDCPTDTVYGYVPIDILASVIDECGGFFGIASKGGAA
jgi:hypothetical protein